MAGETEQTRFRSFAERYVIARAHTFNADPAQEEKDAWECALRARTAYEAINGLSNKYAPKPEPIVATGPQGVAGPQGMTGAKGPRQTAPYQTWKSQPITATEVQRRMKELQASGAPSHVLNKVFQRLQQLAEEQIAAKTNPPLGVGPAIDSKGWTG